MGWNPFKVAYTSGPNCSGCPYRATSVGFAVTQGYKFDYDMGGTWLTYEPGALFLSADYMFLLEALGKDEARQGKNVVGGTGGYFNFLLHDNTPLKRPEVVIANVVKCRPIKWGQCTECQGKGTVNAEHVYRNKQASKQFRLHHGEVSGDKGSAPSADNANTSRDGNPPQVWQQAVHQSSPPDGSHVSEKQETREQGREKRTVCKVQQSSTVSIQDETGTEPNPLQGLPQQIQKAVVCRTCMGKKQVPVRQSNNDFVNEKPEPEQVRECFERYGKAELEAFQGHTFMVLGASALALFAGRGRSMAETVGHIFEPGEMLPCVRCESRGTIPAPRRNCPVCSKRGTEQCQECKRWTKHLKKCSQGADAFGECVECLGQGKLPRPPKICPDCKGNCEIPADPGNIYVSKLLKPGQIMLPTYHPAFLMRQPQKKTLVAKHFARLTDLRGELEVDKSTEYISYPKSNQLDTTFNAPEVSIDLETTSLLATQGSIECIGATHKPSYGVVAEADSRHAYELLKHAEESDDQLIIGQNWAMFDAYWIWKHWKIGLPQRLHDTLLVSHLLDPDSPKKLAHVVHEYADPPIRGYWKTREHYRDDKRTVAIVDTDAAIRVKNGQVSRLEEQGLVSAYWDEVYPTMKTAFNMRVKGWRTNRDALKVAGDRVMVQVSRLREDLPDWPATKSTGLKTENQNEQIRTYLYEVLRLPVILHQKEHKPTGNEDARKQLLVKLKTGSGDTEHLSSLEVKDAVAFLELLQELKDKSKLTQFLNPNSKWLEGDSFHPTWDPAGTATTRFSCREPNLQQVPKCGCKSNGKKQNCYGLNPGCLGARFPFLPDQPGWKMASIDYSQIEVVGFLWSAGQWDVLEKVLHGRLDAHEVMAEALSMDRDEAKNMTFALVYGASDKLIAAASGNSIADVAVARQHYLKIFPGVEDFRRYYIHFAMKHGYVENPFGRKRYLWVRTPIGRAANQAANAPIQGIPPMVARRAMVRLEKELPHEARILGNIHDELIFTYPEGVEEEVLTCARDVMRSPVPELPAAPLGMVDGLVFNIDIEVGTNWANLKTWEKVA